MKDSHRKLIHVIGWDLVILVLYGLQRLGALDEKASSILALAGVIGLIFIARWFIAWQIESSVEKKG